MKKILFMLSIIGVLLFSLSFVQKTGATEPFAIICHHTPGNQVTHEFANEESYNGHLGTPHSTETFDTEGACEEASPTPTPTPTPGEEEHYACVENACTLVEGEGQNTCESNSDCEETTPTPTLTPTVTPIQTSSSTEGGPGDGRSDGLGCGSHDCSNQATTQGQVLGASTGPAVLGLSTTSGAENYLLQLAQLFGALTSAGLGLVFFKK